MTKLEEHFLKSDFIRADENYISDGYCIIAKKWLNSTVLKLAKNTENLFTECSEAVPYEMGEDFFPSEVGTECRLCPHNQILIVYNEHYGFDYDYVKMFYSQFPGWEIVCTYVVINTCEEPLLKFFIDDEFAGCLMCARR